MITQICDQILINAVHNLLNNLRRFIQRLPVYIHMQTLDS